MESRPWNLRSAAALIAASSFTAARIASAAEAWIDVIQDGKSLASTTHSGRRDCPDVRKSVRFDLQTGAVTIQVSGVDSKLIKLAILPAE
jgi:hypothetical protein